MAQHNITHELEEESHNVNRAAKGISYFTPAQIPPAGTALVLEDQKTIAKLFKPLKLRGLTLQNRIMLSPLCQYSAEDGHYTMWHITHMGGIIQRGPGISCVEATAVTPQGRITPEDVGLWKDSQIENLARVVEFAHSQGQKIMIQLGHAGRKASTVAPWLSAGAVAGKDLNGWPDEVYAPSAIPWNENHAQPKELSLEGIEELKKAFNEAVKRALKAGFDAIEVHGAHGYLLHSFVSPVSNQRTDKYGGSFENRTRLIMEIVEETRATIPKDMPLFYRISATDWLEEVPKDQIPESWTNEDSIKLAHLLADAGVDYLDVSSGGNHPLQHPHSKPAYQAPFAIAIKKAVGDKMAVGTVGMIESAKLANQLLEEEGLDMVTVGRGFQQNPGLVFQWADDLGQPIQMPNQIRWGVAGRGGPKGKTVSIFETELWK
ncbi:NADH-dependent flavin oxidoreductase [Friedmanniomyces endolithicus]|uniref:NADH-dependent flavin oxidoreductase n=1 Tax=Friedmanniomyces endolithicus TaxID=329885 RepID=A0A4U0VIX0_9PEZI|nr:NADH-dependent flavin oxidoreductase [Friedmanniomyces endolithicus]KAK0277135.1 NADH-dependent flavin oxidoreductase [Friedmanniomyces endolithicus]KAK0298263.1 NADH-dependent flavin oxidoreductase [Friedmanniomyces endolithicus]KAK0323856.1 NADH-dependent flavin oxidoreductase [Friedmanniomyces endolithicus]KAK0931457.1 NADH-dependent flavin oxidoreductase [Friedmanniomyces endolithicus]